MACVEMGTETFAHTCMFLPARRVGQLAVVCPRFRLNVGDSSDAFVWRELWNREFGRFGAYRWATPRSEPHVLADGSSWKSMYKQASVVAGVEAVRWRKVATAGAGIGRRQMTGAVALPASATRANVPLFCLYAGWPVCAVGRPPPCRLLPPPPRARRAWGPSSRAHCASSPTDPASLPATQRR